MNWTDDRIDLLKKLWTANYSASHIAAEIGGISRNAVIGKVHRLGISARGKKLASSEPRLRKQRPQRTDVTPFKGPPKLPVEPLAIEEEVVEGIIPMKQRCSIIELTFKNCHWPIGDPRSKDFFFCGGKAIEGLPYCSYHLQIAYQPGSSRRQDRRNRAKVSHR